MNMQNGPGKNNHHSLIEEINKKDPGQAPDL
jgi:hypothetical protein